MRFEEAIYIKKKKLREQFLTEEEKPLDGVGLSTQEVFIFGDCFNDCV